MALINTFRAGLANRNICNRASALHLHPIGARGNHLVNIPVNTDRKSQISNSRNNYGFIRKLFGSVNVDYFDIVIRNHAEVWLLLFGKYHTSSWRRPFFLMWGERDGERNKGGSGSGPWREAGGLGDTDTQELCLTVGLVGVGTENAHTYQRFTPGLHRQSLQRVRESQGLSSPVSLTSSRVKCSPLGSGFAGAEAVGGMDCSLLFPGICHFSCC